jgi:SAM-dependent methyltransferase
MKTWSQVWNEKALAVPTQIINQENLQDGELLRVNGFNHDSNSLISVESFEEYISKIADLVCRDSTKYLYEFGCGTGFFTKKLADKMKISDYGGSDASINMIRVAKARNPNQVFEVSEALSFSCDKLDVSIVCNSVFQYFPNLEYAIGVINNVLAHNPASFAFLDIVHRDLNGTLIQREGENDSDKLTHLGFNPEFFSDILGSSGYEVRVHDQKIAGYQQSSQRFNVIGFKKNSTKGTKSR